MEVINKQKKRKDCSSHSLFFFRKGHGVLLGGLPHLPLWDREGHMTYYLIMCQSESS